MVTAPSKDAALQYKIVSTTQTGVTATMTADETINFGSVIAIYKGTAGATNVFRRTLSATNRIGSRQGIF